MHYFLSRVPQDPTPQQDEQAQLPTEPAATKKRPRLDLSEPRERKRGKSMFGIVLGTLNKAKIEDKERNASEAVCYFVAASSMSSKLIVSLSRPKNDN